MVKTLSTPKQRQLIGYFRKLLCLDADTYHDILWTWGVDTSKDLTLQQAETLINQLKKQAIALGKYAPKKQYSFQKYKYNNVAERDSKMATPLQLRKVEALWFRVSNQTNDIDRKNALNAMCERVTGKARLMFLTKTDISKLITALENMQKGQKKVCQA